METTPELKLDYPCEWEYKLFVHTQHCVHTIVKDIVDERLHTIATSQASKNGTYSSYSVTLLVHNDDDRTTLFHAFKSHQYIKFVL